MSETMRGFQGQRQRLVTLMEERRKEAEERRVEEAKMAAALAVERAKSLLRAATLKDANGKVYPTVDLQKAAAEVEVEEMAQQYLVVKALRRSADEAVRTYEKELDAITAAYHAYNRELKVEESLSTTPDSRHSQGGRG